MQLNTAGEHAYFPASVRRFSGSGHVEFSTVHEPADELSFYVSLPKSLYRALVELPVQLNTQLSTWRASHAQNSMPIAASAAEIIDTAKRVTGLSIKDLAAIFKVSRQTLYNYRKSEETINERNWSRLKSVDEHIKAIVELLPHSPGTLMKRVTLDGASLYDLLCAEALDVERIELTAAHLADHLKVFGKAGVRYSSSIDQLTRHA